MELGNELKNRIISFQRNEITEYHLYKRLARTVKSPENRKVLEKIADDELRHYKEWKRYTGTEVSPSRFVILLIYLVCRIFGLTFGIKLMERSEEEAQASYATIMDVLPEIRAIIEEENEHEQELLALIDEERLRYIGSIVLGLNDALVELTGALAGLTLALQRTKLIALTGLITGIAAALSMAASEYLSTKTEETTRSPAKASIYTGLAYIVTVSILILPYLLLDNYFLCLALTILAAVVIIAFFNYYISIVNDTSFRKRFLEMAGISFGVAGLSFFIGYLVRHLLGIEV
jgi:VIT1/CCC1 family predicted Fe2+/Mn2+ transporter